MIMPPHYKEISKQLLKAWKICLSCQNEQVAIHGNYQKCEAKGNKIQLFKINIEGILSKCSTRYMDHWLKNEILVHKSALWLFYCKETEEIQYLPWDDMTKIGLKYYTIFLYAIFFFIYVLFSAFCYHFMLSVIGLSWL